MSYVIISPVKDEEKYIEYTLKSVAAQTVTPLLWIIIDDGSTDNTAAIILKYAATNPYIRLVCREKGRTRQTGTAEVLAFNFGYNLIKETEFDYLVKLDGDLSFDPDYFERLLYHFENNANLGIASGMYAERISAKWVTVSMPSYHAAGASKFIRRTCFEAIAGFIIERGWDTVDEIRAMSLGWETTHFPGLLMKHLKSEGTGMGLLRTAYMHGEIYYRTRGDKLFVILKLINRVRSKPFLVGGIAMAIGYLNAIFRSLTPLVTDAEGNRYRALLRNRIAIALRRPFSRVQRTPRS